MDARKAARPKAAQGLFIGAGAIGWCARKNEIETIETLNWSLSAMKGRLVPWQVSFLVVWMLFGLFLGLFAGLFVGLRVGLTLGLSLGLLLGLITGMANRIANGPKIRETEKISPNEGIWQSARNAVLAWLFFGGVFGLVIMLINPLNIHLPHSLYAGLVVGCSLGLIGGLLCGGAACIKHATLRFLLYRNGSIPLNYIRFLNYCADRIFLRKVGGGYVFIHRMVMEHFAEKATGMLYDVQVEYVQAEPLLKHALSLREKVLGSGHPDVAQSLNNLGMLYDAQGNYAHAEPLLRRALVIREKALDLDHPDVAESMHNLGTLYYAQGKYTQANPLLKRAMAISKKVHGPNSPVVAKSLENMARLYKKSGREKEAEELEKRAAAIRRKA